MPQVPLALLISKILLETLVSNLNMPILDSEQHLILVKNCLSSYLNRLILVLKALQY